MDDDLNTSAALAVLFELAKPLRALANRIERGDADAAHEAQAPEIAVQAALLQELAAVLGLQHEPRSAQPAGTGHGDPSDEAIQALIDQRLAARAARDFSSADRIRDELRAAGIELIDRPGGVCEWLRVGRQPPRSGGS